MIMAFRGKNLLVCLAVFESIGFMNFEYKRYNNQ